MSDDLDDLLRRAMKTLDDRVPPGYFEDFANQTLARLEDSSMSERKEAISAQSSADALPAAAPAASPASPAATAPTAPAAPVVPASATADEPAAKRDEDSGLHDIRSLASSQRMRMVAKRTSQHPIVRDDELLASASGSWKSIALPEPAKMVSLPELSELPAARDVKEAERRADERDSKAVVERVEAAAAASAKAAPEKAKATAAAVEAPSKREAAAVTPIEKAKAKPAAAPAAKGSKKNAAIVAGSLAVAAAAGAVMVISSKDSAPPPQVAAPAPAARQEVALPELRSAQPVAPTVTAIEPAAGAAAPAPEVKPPEPEPPAVTKPAPAVEKPSKSAGKYVPNVVEDPKPVEKPKAPEAPKKGDPGDPDFDKLLKEAGYQDKAAEAPKLEKKSLSGDDIKKGMNAVAAKVTACYQGTEGSAAVRLTVAPSGQVQKVTVSGVFAGTPVGSCVEAAVQGASFPPWDGGPQTVSYSYLLSE